MASLREEARWVLDDARDGICWIAVWKTGRSWHCEALYGCEYTESNQRMHIDAHWDIDTDDMDRMREILAEDQDACLVNGYYYNLGSLEEMTLDSLVDGLRWQYDINGNMASIVTA